MNRKNRPVLCRLPDAKLPSGLAQQRELIIKVKGKKKEEVDFLFFQWPEDSASFLSWTKPVDLFLRNFPGPLLCTMSVS